MAATDITSSSFVIPTKSHDTALCIIPPNTSCGDVDRLRELYDNAYGSWPAHINLIYPFVTPESLPQAQQQIQAQLDRSLDPSEPRTVTLDEAGLFKHRSNSTVFLQETRSGPNPCLQTLRSMALQALGHKNTAANLHLTIGQTTNNTLFSQQFLLAKARLLPSIDFGVGALAILVRERTADANSTHRMRLWGVINVAQPDQAWIPRTPEHWLLQLPQRPVGISTRDSNDEESGSADQTISSHGVQTGQTYHYEPRDDKWSICTVDDGNHEKGEKFSIASYNVLIDSEYPPTQDRDPHLVQTILSKSASANILVLQEVSDDFLSYMLSDAEVQRRYPFTSHAPPNQPDIGPLSNLRNIVILSSQSFDWKFVPFREKHKGALVARFPQATTLGSDLIVAGVHLTAGLTDGSVAAKNDQLQNLTSYLTRHHPEEPWIIAGDFNLATSMHTINSALEDKSTSTQTVAALSTIETTMSELGLVDAWTVAHVEGTDELFISITDELFEGEEGATFDPRNNLLAATTSGTSKYRPQRYDRVLVRSQKKLRVSSFNHFGLPQDINGAHVVPSDHSGVRATLVIMEAAEIAQAGNVLRPSVKHIRPSSPLADANKVLVTLSSHHMLPTKEEFQQRQASFALLKQVVSKASERDHTLTPDIPMVIVPVGSYALDVWTSESDVDCLCIGTISSKTFFKLARHRLLKAAGQGVQILRKVEAGTGTMLELTVNGVAMDLQYCPAARVVDR